MKRHSKLWWLGLLVSLAVLVATAIYILTLPAFGKRAEGARLDQMHASPEFRDGHFVNDEPEAATDIAQLVSYARGQFGGAEVRVPPAPLPVVAIDPAELASKPANSGLKAFWIGHAGVYLEIDGLRVMLDPVFSEYASPFAFGPKRFHPPPIMLADLPRIDVVLISHDHYDHLDMATVRALAVRGTNFFVPLGVGAHLQAWAVPKAQIHEFDWWQEQTVAGVKFVSTPTRHYSGRGLTDRSTTLWSSWSVLGPANRIYYSGDTGFSNHFREIGQRFGPFDMAFIKIGAYGPGPAWTDIHMTPEDAVRASREVRAMRMFPVHWSTFNLAFHSWDEPIRRAASAAKEQKVDLVTPRIGEMVPGGQVFASRAWWESVR